MRVSAALPLGVSALLFDSARRRRRLEGVLAERLCSAGFEEVILPILDYFEPYEPLLTPAGRGELYRFVDRDGELLALRADSTPMLARLLAPRIATLPLPLRLFYRGDVVRYQEERAGLQREFYEMGAELVGLPGEQAEHDMLLLFLELLALAETEPPPQDQAPAIAGASNEIPAPAGALNETQVVLGFAGALDVLLLAAGGDDPSRLAAAVARRERGEVRRTAPRLPALLEIVEHGVPERPGDLGESAAERLRGLLALAAELAARFPRVELTIDLAEFARQSLDPRLARLGEASGERPYYDGLVFRAYRGAAALPVGGGGRYDRLFRSLGADVPAVGFSLGLDRLLQVGARGTIQEGGAARPLPGGSP
ncbi:MAG TPA: ATP phosphoribosyltransferase regulatory subunit [Thermoanaerobaculia bacterium]|nr:ATP phosphoribosyltransferase regulatory subunit [Thermoanaerobaculia bacterium]